MIYVFVDTNIIGTYDGKNSVSFSMKEHGSVFISFIKFVNDYELQSNIKIQIPEIVCKEIKKQLEDSFTSKKQTFGETIQRARDLFGELLTVDYSFGIHDISVANIKKGISDKYSNTSFPNCPNDKKTFQKVIVRALEKQLPFKKSGETSDAGFKDVLIWETILKQKLKKGDLLIFITDNLSDFRDAIEMKKSNAQLVIESNLELIKAKILSALGIKVVKIEAQEHTTPEQRMVMEKISRNRYLQDESLSVAGIIKDKEYNLFITGAVEKDEQFVVDMRYEAGDIKTEFAVKYDAGSNSITGEEVNE